MTLDFAVCVAASASVCLRFQTPGPSKLLSPLSPPRRVTMPGGDLGS